ncbi:MAG: NAD(P)H-binding protein [Actinomycetota bacterium]
MRVSVIGATGGTGRLVVAYALARGHGITVLLRDAAAATEFLGADVVVGDIRDPGAVGAAVNGADAVISCLGVRLGQAPGTVRSRGTATLVSQMRAQNVRRLLAVSAVGVGSSRADQSRGARMMSSFVPGRARLAEAYAAEQEIVCAAGEVDWTIVRAPRLVDKDSGAAVTVAESVRVGLRSQLTRNALAQVLLDELDDPRHLGTAVTAVNAA